MEVAEYFELDVKTAHTITAEVGRSVAAWRREAGRHGFTTAEIDRMASAFEHEDLKAAVGSRSRAKRTRG